MREILFRGKRIDNGEWIEGHYIFVQDAVSKEFYHCIVKSGGEMCVSELWDYEFIDKDTLSEFTGCYDKNGKRIFEGDILKIVHKYQSPFDDDTNEYTDITTDVVFFDDEGLCFSYGKSPFLCVVDNVTAEYEVIGNIHDDNLEELANGR